MNTKEALITLQDVSVTYPTGTHALQQINLQVGKGEFVAVMGPSGSGKTTLLNCISCYIPADSGEITLGNRQLAKLDETALASVRNKQLGFVFQDFRLIPSMTVYENIAFVLRVIDAPTSYIKKRVAYVIDLVGLQDKAKNYPNELSGGEMQRVAIARALVNDPQLIIADEPTGNIDPELSYEIVDLLREINECGTTILMVTHEHSLVRYFGGRIITIQQGRIVFDEVVGGNLIHES